MIKCDICDKECKTERALKLHHWKVHTEAGQNHKPMLGKKHTEESKEKNRNSNKGRIPWSKGKKFPGRKIPLEVREKIASSMKEAHAEGRAHNLGSSRGNNEPSWPEKFFMQVIEN